MHWIKLKNDLKHSLKRLFGGGGLMNCQPNAQ